MENSEKEKQRWLDGIAAIGQKTIFTPLGIKVIDVDDDQIVLTMPITDASRQALGLLHGGVSMVLAESAASIHATWNIDLNEKIPVGIEINGSHLSSASDGTVKAIGRVIRRSYKLIVHQIDIIHVESDTLLSTARVTNYYKSNGS